MRKAIKRLLIGFVVLLVIIAGLLPAVVPPLVESIAEAKLAEFGLEAIVKMSLGYCWRNGPGIVGKLQVQIKDSPCPLFVADFGASCCEWSAAVKMEETPFSESDPVIRTLLAKYPVTAVSNLTFSGSIALDAKAERTFRTPVPVWSAKLPVKDFSASLMAKDKSYAVSGLSVTPAASGIADHLDLAPMFLRIHAADAAGFSLANFTASIRATERSLLVTEATAGLCGGKIALYSLVLDPKTLNTGFTLFVDDVDAGETLRHFKGFRGEASGKLHGKVKLFVKEGGKALRLGDAFLYSTPGEVGKLRMADAAPVTDNLALAGIDNATRANVADALTDLDYSVLKLNIRRGADKTATLSVNLNGTATRGKTSVPVNLTLNFNGELEQLVNMGLGLSAQTKGKQK